MVSLPSVGKFSQSSKRQKFKKNNAHTEPFTTSQMKKFNQFYQQFQVESYLMLKQIISKMEKWLLFYMDFLINL